jgi:hypothetical protein
LIDFFHISAPYGCDRSTQKQPTHGSNAVSFRAHEIMSALPPIATKSLQCGNRREGPIGDILFSLLCLCGPAGWEGGLEHLQVQEASCYSRRARGQQPATRTANAATARL